MDAARTSGQRSSPISPHGVPFVLKPRTISEQCVQIVEDGHDRFRQAMILVGFLVVCLVIFIGIRFHAIANGVVPHAREIFGIAMGLGVIAIVGIGRLGFAARMPTRVLQFRLDLRVLVVGESFKGKHAVRNYALDQVGLSVHPADLRLIRGGERDKVPWRGFVVVLECPEERVLLAAVASEERAAKYCQEIAALVPGIRRGEGARISAVGYR